MNLKTIILLVAAVLSLFVLFNLPCYTRWLENKIFTVCNIDEQLERMGIEERREMRYGYSYVVFKDVASKLHNDHDATVLLPPDGYLIANKIDVRVVEPSTFYYYTKQKAVFVTSPQVHTATWALLAESPGHLALIKLKNAETTDSLLQYLKKYPQR